MQIYCFLYNEFKYFFAVIWKSSKDLNIVRLILWKLGEETRFQFHVKIGHQVSHYVQN